MSQVEGTGETGRWTLTRRGRSSRRRSKQGLYYFDCADVYGLGACERVVGLLLRELLPRDEYVIATKISGAMGDHPNQRGLSRKHIVEAVDASLERLGLDYIDHLVIHRHPHGVHGGIEVPIEETLEGLHDVVKAGKVLYLGVRPSCCPLVTVGLGRDAVQQLGELPDLFACEAQTQRGSAEFDHVAAPRELERPALLQRKLRAAHHASSRSSSRSPSSRSTVCLASSSAGPSA